MKKKQVQGRIDADAYCVPRTTALAGEVCDCIALAARKLAKLYESPELDVPEGRSSASVVARMVRFHLECALRDIKLLYPEPLLQRLDAVRELALSCDLDDDDDFDLAEARRQLEALEGGAS